MMLKRIFISCVLFFAAAMFCGAAHGDDRADMERLGKTLVSQLKQYQQAAGASRKTAGAQAIDTLLKIARLRAINDEPFLADDALAQAKRIATDAAPEMLHAVNQAQKQTAALLEIGKQMRRLVKTLKSNPQNLDARNKLVMDVLVLTLDKPQEAKKYLSADMDDAIISRVNLAAGDAEKYPPQAVLELADWYFTLMEHARPDQLANVLIRAKTYYELYRKMTDNDLDEKTIANLDRINALLKEQKISVDISPMLTQAKDTDISAAIDNAQKYLIDSQQSDGAFPPFATEFDVTNAQWPTPLITRALLRSGMKASDPVIGSAMKFMQSYKSDNKMYQAMLCSLLSMQQVRDAKTVAALADQLQIESGIDSLITRHYVTAALNDATSAGANVKRIHWIKTLNFYRLSQNSDGGWGFSENRPTRHIPTLIAVTDMIISLKQLGKNNAAVYEHPNVKKAMAWLEKNFDKDVLTDQMQYYLLLTELAAARNTAVIDNRDSLKWVAEELLHVQEKDGSWKADNNSPHVSTAMALLCLTAGKK